MDIDSNYPDTIKLNISSKNIRNCHQVAFLLQKSGIISNISPNFSVIEKGEHKILENGCNIILTKTNLNHIEPIWNTLKKEYSLGCAYLEVENKYKGCIYNFLRKNNCPG